MIAMSGEENRKMFFGERSLGFTEGYQVLLGKVPKLEDINHDGLEHSDLLKRLTLLFQKERINEGALTIYVPGMLILTFASVLPLLLEDVNRRMKDWGSEGKLNPFKEVDDVSLYFLASTCLVK